jgi:hypothetical protein
MFPRTVLAAGIIWIVFGALTALILSACLILIIWAYISVLAREIGRRELSPGAPEAIGRMVIIGLVLFAGSFIASVFVLVGVQTIRGRPSDTLRNGVASIIFGVLFAGLPPTGTALLVAGILDLVDRSTYKVWRKTRRTPRTAAASRTSQASTPE